MAKTQKKDTLGIEKLLLNLEHASHETKRLPRDVIKGILSQIVNEIPYASQVIPLPLADNLLSDTPQLQTSLEINDIIINLGKAMCDPLQKDNIASLIHSYRHDRKKTEKIYAESLLEEVLKETSYHTFSTAIQPALKEITLNILEKIINEKQLRKIQGYRIQPLIEITESFIYIKHANLELEKIKINQSLTYRKFINAAAQTAYEKITDEKKLADIHKEKVAAYQIFKTVIAEKIPSAANLKKFQATILFLQKDQQQKQILLKKKLEALLKPLKKKPLMKELANPLSIRIIDKLRRTFRLVDLDPSIYASEEAITKAHEEAFAETEEDANSLINLATIVLSIRENFDAKTLRFLFGRSALKNIETALVDILLGKNIRKIDPVTAEYQWIRAGGYPLKNIVEIYSAVMTYLKNAEENSSGLFSDDLKKEIAKANQALRSVSQTLRIVTHAPSPIKRPVEAVSILPSKSESEAMLKSLVEASTQQALTPETPAKETEPQPSLFDEQFDIEPTPAEPVIEKVEPKPLLIDEQIDTEPTPAEPVAEKVEPKPLLIDEQFDTEPTPAEPVAEKVEPKPLLIDEQFDTEPTPAEPVAEKVEPKPLLIDEQFDTEPVPAEPAEKVEPKPLLIDEQFDNEPMPAEPVTEKVEPKPLLIDEQFDTEPMPAEPVTEKVETKPLLIDEQFEEEPLSAETSEAPPEETFKLEAANIDQPTQDLIEAGFAIMKNYQLGEFEQPVRDSWKSMVINSSEPSNDLGLGSDNEVRLYVICDLAQQVAAIKEETLSTEHKTALQNIKSQLLEALKNPLDEKNWDCFEGTQRDYIDGTLAVLNP